MNKEDMEFNEPKIIKTQDENGEIHNFEMVDIVTVDDQEYGLLIYLDENEEHEDEEEVIILKLSKVDGAYSFETIEDDEEFNKVVSHIEAEGGLEELEEKL